MRVCAFAYQLEAPQKRQEAAARNHMQCLYRQRPICSYSNQPISLFHHVNDAEVFEKGHISSAPYLGMSRPASVTGSNATSNPVKLLPKPKLQAPSSNISIFVSNLRLLDLDRRADWPDITVKTFDSKDALQNQKKRISCIEWALFRLYEIHDPETTKDASTPPEGKITIV